MGSMLPDSVFPRVRTAGSTSRRSIQTLPSKSISYLLEGSKKFSASKSLSLWRRTSPKEWFGFGPTTKTTRDTFSSISSMDSQLSRFPFFRNILWKPWSSGERTQEPESSASERKTTERWSMAWYRGGEAWKEPQDYCASFFHWTFFESSWIFKQSKLILGGWIVSSRNDRLSFAQSDA